MSCLVAVALTACGGGSGGGSGGGPPPPPDTELNVQGTAQKGLFEVLEVQALPVDAATGALGTPVNVPVSGQNFSIEIAHNQLTLFEATGTFTSEIDGSLVETDKPLRLIVAPGTADITANINIATTLIAELVLRDLRAGVGTPGALLQQHTDFINTVLGFPAGTDPSALDFNAITENSDLTDPNLQLLVLSAGLVEILDSDQLYTGGFQTIVDGVLAAENTDEAITALSVLNGLTANAIYALAQQYSGFNLPMLVLGNNFYVFVCITTSGCSWQEVTKPLVSVSGTTGWEAGGKARVYVRLNEPSAEPVRVALTATSGTATAGEDFIGIVQSVVVPAGVMTVHRDINVIIDARAEPNETITVSIESQTAAYPVFQGVADVTIRDGASSTLADQDAAGMQIVSFDLAALCNPVTNMNDEHCRLLDGTETSLGIVAGRANLAQAAIDLAADCGDPSNCPQRGTNWLVDFFLVAKDGGTPVSEVLLGPYLYTLDSVQLVTDPPNPRQPYIRLTDDASLALAEDAVTNGWDLELEARLGTTNPLAAADTVAPLVTAPDSVLVGDTLLGIGIVYDVLDGAANGCAAGQYALDAQYLQTFPYGGEEASLVVGAGVICVDFDAGGAGAGPAVMVEGRLDIIGGSADPDAETTIVLPQGLYSRIESETDVGPPFNQTLRIELSYPFLVFRAPNPNSTGVLELHAHGWPFVFVPGSFALTAAGLEIGYSDMRYVMDVGYSTQDPRAFSILYSNDIFYRGVAGKSGTLILGPNGVSGDITVAGGPGFADHTAFPRARVEWQEFSQSVVDNELAATSVTLDEYRLGQSTACYEPGCVQGSKDWFSVAGAVALDGDGDVLGDTANVGAHTVPRFGAREGGDHAWSRPDDLAVQPNLKLAVPGYVISNAVVSDVLIGHLDDGAVPGEIDVHPAGSAAFADGNHFPTGMSVGPEIYRDGSGIPAAGDGQDIGSLGTALRLDNGEDAAFDLQSSPAVKYVIRNAGITGVFNVASASLGATSPQFYGYPLDLERFAVRAVDNALDTETWIDGRLALQGDAGGADGLDIFFTNLEIDCNAKLGNIDLMYEACDARDNNGNGEIDENCAPELYAWQAPTDIFAARFTGSGNGQACIVGAQRFGMDHQVHFEALDKPVAFETEWTPAGFIDAQTSGQLPAYRFDRSEEGRGFPVRTSNEMPDHVRLGSAEVDSDRYGWLEFRQTRVGVPFWNAIDSDLRLANVRRFGDVVAEPTVVLKEGELAGQNGAQRNADLLRAANAQSASDNSRAIKAEYEWGRTGFGFRMPVYYQPWQLDRGNSDADARGRQSRFLGRQLTKDLFVLDANAGINFIEPDRTKLSFGASADFTRLEGLEFQVDITDARSARAVDAVLQDLRITNGPLFEPALSDVLETVDIVNRLANRGLDEILETALETALEEVGKATAPLTPNNQDPFVTVSEILTQLKSMPQQMTALIEEDLEEPLGDRLAQLKDQLRQALIELEAAILSVNGTEPLVERLGKFELIDAAAERVRTILDQVEAEVRTVDQQMTATLQFSADVFLEALSYAQELSTALENVKLVMRQATAVVDSACRDGLLIDEEGTGFLTAAANRVAAVRRVADVVRNGNEWLAAAETIAQNDDVKRQLATARQRIRDATDELIGFVDAADDTVSSLVCQPEAIDEVVQFAEAYADDLLTGLAAAQQQLIGALVALQQAQGIKDQFAERIYEPIRTVRAALTPATDPNTTDAGDGINRVVSCILYRASHDETAEFCPLILSQPVPDAQPPYGINALANNGGNERDIADALFFVIEDEIDTAFADVKEALVAATQGLLPGAYMSPEELRRMLVAEIMRSQPVRDLRLAMDRHFGEVAYALNGIVLQIVDQVNFVVESALAAVTGPINDALREATSVVRGIPLQSAGMNGFATIAGNELERAHISAGWTMRGGDDDDKTGFRAALDAESWSAKHTNPDVNTPTACALAPGESRLDVKISAYGLPINVMAADINIEKLYLGFTLESGQPDGPALVPVGIFGGINTIGEIGFSDAVVFDPAFAAGLGAQQTYIGASAGAVFSSLTADVAFLVGRVCPGNSVITDLDPDVEKFLPNLPASGFTGAYLRGGATIPIIPGGCALNVGVVADFGTWIFVGQPTTFGGLVGGGATGQVACIAALKGKVTVGGSASTDGDLKLVGEGWGVAGVGLDCNPGTWTSVPRSRDDDWCGTGDAQFDATFDNGRWQVNPPKPSAIH
ncbi:MAG: hypothetical protein R3176_02770 [Woeseiaceae bacterium]|nr:hypothetical protein [Woeseiaceae bacterium]